MRTAAILFILLVLSLSGFAQSLSIPGFNQAYRDATGYWGECPMGTGGCPDRIETAGCLITSLAAVLDYYRIRLAVPAAESCTGSAQFGMDPGILNAWLRTHGGYGRCSTDPVGDCCLEWSAVTQVELRQYENTASTGVSSTARAEIDRALGRGYPVIAGVHWGAHCHGTTTQSENCHWVVITGAAGTTYTITDPYNRDVHDPHGVHTTLNHGVFGAYTIDRFVVAAGPVPAQPEEAIRITLSPGGLPGEVEVTLSARTGGEYKIFVQVVDPAGNVYYARRPAPGSTRMEFSGRLVPLLPTPIYLAPGEDRIGSIVLQKPGEYSFLVRLEDPNRPGTAVASAVAAYAVESGSPPPRPVGWGEIGLAIGAALMLSLFVALIAIAAKP